MIAVPVPYKTGSALPVVEKNWSDPPNLRLKK